MSDRVGRAVGYGWGTDWCLVYLNSLVQLAEGRKIVTGCWLELVLVICYLLGEIWMLRVGGFELLARSWVADLQFD